ncbi:hypothetical protein AMI01nite_08890 [Aneurinibacillus migulanus]|nr:hypothetical protein AMI01nite_08890 [Aneurinibacillus migulanus]
MGVPKVTLGHPSFLQIKKVYVAIKQESNIHSLPIVSLEKLARRVPNLSFYLWSAWHSGRKRPTTVSLI